MIMPTLSTQRLQTCVVVAHPNSWYATRACRALRQLGWDVCSAATGAEVRRLVRKLRPAAVILSTYLADESGWLTCSKLMRQQGGLQVFLIEPKPTSEHCRFADFVGAAGLIDEYENLEAVIEDRLGSLATAAG
jgi:hypothetical protein